MWQPFLSPIIQSLRNKGIQPIPTTSLVSTFAMSLCPTPIPVRTTSPMSRYGHHRITETADSWGPEALDIPHPLGNAISKGYSVAATDGGHELNNLSAASWALLSPGNVDLYRLQDFASVALNDMTVIGKRLP